MNDQITARSTRSFKSRYFFLGSLIDAKYSLQKIRSLLLYIIRSVLDDLVNLSL